MDSFQLLTASPRKEPLQMADRNENVLIDKLLFIGNPMNLLFLIRGDKLLNRIIFLVLIHFSPLP